MKLGDYAVQIHGGRERDTGYVEIAHDTKYTILLSNDGELNCDAVVEIDGKEVGIWRVDSGENISIERPVHDTGLFTFYKLGSSEAEKIGLVRNDKLGLLSVLFKSEKPPVYTGGTVYCYPSFYSAGGTGLSGKSEQKFIDVKPLDYNESAFVQINLRLVCNDDEPRPLTPNSTLIPPPICPSNELISIGYAAEKCNLAHNKLIQWLREKHLLTAEN